MPQLNSMRSSGHRKSGSEHCTIIRGTSIPLLRSPPTPWTSPFSNGKLCHDKTATTIPICNPSRLVQKFQRSVRAAHSTSPLPQTPLWKSFWRWSQKNGKTGCSYMRWFEVVNQCVRQELPEILRTLRHEVLPTPNQTQLRYLLDPKQRRFVHAPKADVSFGSEYDQALHRYFQYAYYG